MLVNLGVTVMGPLFQKKKMEEFVGQPRICYILEKDYAPWRFVVCRV